MHVSRNHAHSQGLYQKAETMYAMGDFEYALVFYHRGDKIRPDIKAFTLGIQKAQEAINNSIGCKRRIIMTCNVIKCVNLLQLLLPVNLTRLVIFHSFSNRT